MTPSSNLLKQKEISGLSIREIKKSEYPVLEEMLYDAIFQRPGSDPLPFNIIYKPEIYVFIDRFGEFPDDYCLVAELNGEIIGAAWSRILSGEKKGFGYIDDHTPEFAISMQEKFRNCGIGTRLIQLLLLALKEKGYKQVSLSVDKDNYAVKMYEKAGFSIVGENKYDYIMVYRIK